MFHLTAPCPTGPNKAGRKERGYLSEDFEGPPRSLTVDASFRAFAQDTPVTSRYVMDRCVGLMPHHSVDLKRPRINGSG